MRRSLVQIWLILVLATFGGKATATEAVDWVTELYSLGFRGKVYDMQGTDFFQKYPQFPRVFIVDSTAVETAPGLNWANLDPLTWGTVRRITTENNAVVGFMSPSSLEEDSIIEAIAILRETMAAEFFGARDKQVLLLTPYARPKTVLHEEQHLKDYHLQVNYRILLDLTYHDMDIYHPELYEFILELRAYAVEYEASTDLAQPHTIRYFENNYFKPIQAIVQSLPLNARLHFGRVVNHYAQGVPQNEFLRYFVTKLKTCDELLSLLNIKPAGSAGLNK